MLGSFQQRYSRLACLRGLALTVFAATSLSAQAAEITVSAAASLTQAFREVAAGFEASHPGDKVLLNFAASDALLAQIAKGAPVDVFASADQETMDKAAAQQLLRPGSRRNFAINALVLITPSSGALPLQLLGDLQKPEVKRIAIGQPEGVPAGRYAKSALMAAQLWSPLEAKMVYAQNVRQSLDYVARGEVEAGFVYATDAAIQKDKVTVRFTVPTQKAISYPLGILKDAPNPAGGSQFVDYLFSPAGQAVLARYGFGKP